MKKQQSEDFIYGIHPVMEAIQFGQELDMLLVQRKTNPALKEIVSLAREKGITVRNVPSEKLNRTTRKEHQGVIAFLNRVPNQDLNELITRVYEKGATPLILICDGITDVRNIGAMARSAECMGAHALVVPKTHSARLGSDAIKSSAGALLRLPVCRFNQIKEALKDCRDQGLKVFGLSEKGHSLIMEHDLNVPVAIVMGDEHDGLSDQVIRSADELVSIPMKGSIGSLNVSVATGMTLYEISRQRR